MPLESVMIEVPEGIDAELPRDSLWRLEAAVPAGAEQVQVTWPDGAGALVLRQQGVEDPYTGYLAGGEKSPELALSGGRATLLMYGQTGSGKTRTMAHLQAKAFQA